MAAAAVMRASHRATRVTAAPAAALTSLPRKIRDSMSPVQTEAPARSYRVVRLRRAGNDGCSAVDADGPASLLPGLELFVHSLLFCDDGPQRVGHLQELLLVCVVEFVHALGERPVYDLVAASVPGGCLMYHGDNFPQEGELFVL